MAAHLAAKRRGARFGCDPLEECETWRMGRGKSKTYEIGRSGVDLEGQFLLFSTEIDVESVGAESRSDTAERLEIWSDVHVKRTAARDAE